MLCALCKKFVFLLITVGLSVNVFEYAVIRYVQSAGQGLVWARPELIKGLCSKYC